MRVLVSTTPGWGHVSPVLPIAEELRRRGHHVVWVTASDAARGLGERGFDVELCGLVLGDRLPQAARLLAELAADVRPEQRRAHAFTINFALLGALQTFDRVGELTSNFRPDVIVREPAELASAAVAHTYRIPYATIGFGGIVPAPARRMASEALAAQLTSAGIVPGSDDWHFGDLYLHPMPASLDSDDVPATARRVRPWSSSAPTSSAPTSHPLRVDARFFRARPMPARSARSDGRARWSTPRSAPSSVRSPRGRRSSRPSVVSTPTRW